MAEDQTAYSYQAPDELVYNLLTGRGDQFGLLPTVADYYRSQFDQLGEKDKNPFTYTGQRIAGFSPREELAMQLADKGIGSFQPFLSRAGGLSEEALATLAGGTSEAKSQLLRALQQGEDYTRFGIDEGAEFVGAGVDKASEAERGLLNALSGVRGRGEEGYQSGLANILQGAREGRAGLDQAQPFFTQARQAGLAGTDDAERLARAAQAQADPFISEALGGVRAGRESELGRTREAAALARGAEGIQDPFIQEALGQTRASTAGFDTADIDRFQNPFENAVVQQTIQDLEKARAQGDIAARAQDISSGAFGGSRARLGASERDTAAQRGLTEALAGIRAGGFTSSRDAAMGEFARQRAAEAGAAGTTAGLGAQRAGARTGLASLIAGLGGQEGAAQRGSAAEIAGLGGQRGAALERLASTVGNLGGARAGFETGAGSALSNLAQQRFGIGTGTGSQQAGLGTQSAAAQLAAAQAGQGAKQATAATLGQAGQQLFGMGTGAGQQLFGMGSGAGQQLSGLAGQLAGGQQQGAQAMTGLAQLTPQLRAGDVQSLMNVGAMNRARNQAQLDLNYQNFVGQYNLPQQLASGFANFLTGAGPLAGGTGYSGTTPATPFGQPGQGTYTGSFYSGGGQGGTGKPIPEGNKGLVSLANKAPEVVKRMGFQVPQKKRSGGIVNSRFPMASRKMGA